MIAKQSTFKKFIFSKSKWIIVICEIKEAFAGFRWPRSHLKCQLSGHLAKNEILYCFNLDSSKKSFTNRHWIFHEKWSRNIDGQAPRRWPVHFRFWVELKRPFNFIYIFQPGRPFIFIFWFELKWPSTLAYSFKLKRPSTFVFLFGPKRPFAFEYSFRLKRPTTFTENYESILVKTDH